MSCPFDISHAGTSLSPLSLFTLLTAITNHTHVHPLLFRHEEHEFSIDFHPSITVFTPNEMKNRTEYPSSFCHFQGANREGFRAWLSICHPDHILMILNAPFASFTLNQSNGTFSVIPKTNDTCDNLSYHLSKRSSNFPKNAYLHDQSLPEYYKEFSRIFPRKRYVEYAMFGDYSLFYDALNIELRLVHMSVIKSPTFKFTEKEALLTSFGDYLDKKFENDHWDHSNLMIGGKHFGEILGLAFESLICSPEGTRQSVSWIEDVGGSDALKMGHLLAHEMGHSLGMLHDGQFPNTNCECKMMHCIMFPHVQDFNYQFWSKCSLANLEQMYKVQADYCLWNEPGVTKEVAQCGNGIVDTGEECDCGPLGCVTHKCCEAATCKFRAGAKCAFGSCCDVNTCSIAASTQICRGAKTSCDLPEFCDGASVDCAAADKHRTDGEKCPDDQDAICYGGRCASRKLQCKTMWGEDARPSPDHCYNNNLCKPLEKDAQTGFHCQKEDKRCGLLHCNVPNFKIDPMKRYNKGFLSFPSAGDNKCKRTYTYYQKGHNPEYYHGMILDGTSCGDGKMCLNQKCVVSPIAPAYKPEPDSGSTADPAIYIVMAFLAVRV